MSATTNPDPIAAAENAVNAHNAALNDTVMYGPETRQRTHRELLEAIAAAYPRYADHPVVVYKVWLDTRGTVAHAVGTLRAQYAQRKDLGQPVPPPLGWGSDI